MPTALRQLAADYWEDVLRRTPTLATFHGDFRFNDRLPEVGAEARADEQAALQRFLDRLDQLDSARLEVEDQITTSMLRLALETSLEAIRLRVDQLGVDQMEGPQVWLPELLNWHPSDSREHIEQLITRYRAFPRFMDQYLDNLSDGIREGRVSPGIAVARVKAQLEALLSVSPQASALAGGGRLAQPQLATDLPAVVGEIVFPAFRRMLEFLQDYPARPEPGIWSITDGPATYAFMARQHTTTQLSPEELHQIGLDDLASIHAEMRQIMTDLGEAETTSIRQFTERLTRDPANLPTSREQLLERSQQLLDQAQAALPRAFGRLPRTPCMVKPVDEFRERDAPAAYYFEPSADGARPGTFYVNTFEPSARPLHTLPALAFHEAVPGHHLQIALGQELEDVPAFRRLGGWFATAFVEGWALYTERLADELGLYPDELARFGMLGYQAWRACRLVVDTGIHAQRWSRQRAIDFFFDNVGLTERETVNEVDRYIVWPGQALAYKVGQREIERLRRAVQQRQGQTFDLRAFHDALLAHSAVPLSTLRLILEPG